MKALSLAVILAACNAGGPIVAPDAGDDDLPPPPPPVASACGDHAVWRPLQTLTIPQGSGGVAAALDGDVAVLGVGGYSEPGHVRVFHRDEGTWLPDGDLTIPWGGWADNGGGVVAASGRFVAVAAPSCEATNDDSRPGAVYVFARGSAGWDSVATVTAPEPTAGDCFGRGLALERTRLAVASRTATFVYDCGGDGCALSAEIPGASMSVALHGERLAIGRGDAVWSEGRTWNGVAREVRIYEHGGVEWRKAATLRASAASDVAFGTSIALGASTLVVGAPSMVVPEQGLPRCTAGAVYAFEREATGWENRARLTADTRCLGVSVGIAEDRIVAGARAPAAFVFQRRSGTWQQEIRWDDSPATSVLLPPPDAVAISRDTVLVARAAIVVDEPWSVEGSVYQCFPAATF